LEGRRGRRRRHEKAVTDTTTSTSGVLIATYAPAGEVRVGSFALENPAEPEIERRGGCGCAPREQRFGARRSSPGCSSPT
jgi:hypothetical protein